MGTLGMSILVFSLLAQLPTASPRPDDKTSDSIMVWVERHRQAVLASAQAIVRARWRFCPNGRPTSSSGPSHGC